MPAVTYVPEPILEIEGAKASKELMQDILQISVEESLHLPGMFTIVIQNSYFPGRSEDKAWKHEALFAIGKKIKISFGSSTTEAEEFKDQQKGSVLEGEITAIESHFTGGSQAPIIIRGYDISHRLHRGRYNRSFQNMTDTDIVNKIAGEVGIPTKTVDATGGPYGHDGGYIFQENQTNMEFLRERAAINGFELFIQDGKLNFRKPKVDGNLELKWLEELHSFRVRVSSSEQVKEVEVRGWDYSKKQEIVANQTIEQVLSKNAYSPGSKTSQAFKGQPPTPKMIVVDQAVYIKTQADQIAQGLCNELGGEFVQADAISNGNPDIRPGKVIKIKDMGKYTGEYYVTETHHLFHERTYTTEFTVRGLRGGDLFSLLAPQTRFQPGQTLIVGIVTNNKDPKGWGRVRVKFPTLTQEHESNWARVVTIGAGSGRGFDCLPEVNDEVLVGFEHGDIHRPYVIGNVWNGTDAPPEKVDDSVVGGKVRLRTFKTRTGHKFQFREEDKGNSQKGIYLDTVYGHHIYLNDTEQFIEIKTSGGHIVRLDDKNKKIEIKTSGGHSYIMDDMSKKISLSSTGTIEVTAPQQVTITVGGTKINMNPTAINIESSSSTMKGTANAKVEGALVNVEASGLNTIKGAFVKIN